MNLTGRWKGKYTYGAGYPQNFIGKSEPFEFDIQDIEGKITGVCVDEIVKAIEGNESTIEGTFKDNFISFIKRYKYQLLIDESNNYVSEENIITDGVHYVGHVHKRFFSRKVYFTGEWQITADFKDDHDKIVTFSVEGTWTMSRV